MPKIYRVMNGVNGRPTIGDSAVDLGVRVPTDIMPDADGNVAPNLGGMSVSPMLQALPSHRLPKRLRFLIPKAAGKDSLFVWSLGDGAFQAEAVAPNLRLRPDPANDKHGFVEPDRLMPLSQYQSALAATQDEWRVDETG